MTKCTKLYDPVAYGLVSIQTKRFFYEVMLQPWPWPLTSDLEKRGFMYLLKLLKHVLVFVILQIYWLLILLPCQVTDILHGLLKPA
jgi:hypothetical protein